MKIFVHGTTGMSGRHVVSALVAGGHEPVCLAESGQKKTQPGVRLIHGQTHEWRGLHKGMAGCAALVHMMGMPSFWVPSLRWYMEETVYSARIVVEAALRARVRHVVLVSSAFVYGRPRRLPFTEKSPLGRERFSDCSRALLQGEQLVRALCAEKDVSLTVLYPALVLGPGGQDELAEEMRELVRGRLPFVPFPDSMLTFVHERDLSGAVLGALERGGQGFDRYLVGRYRMSVKNYLALVAAMSDRALPRLHLPGEFVLAAGRVLTRIADLTGRKPWRGLAYDCLRTLQMGLEMDGSRAERELGVCYTPVSVAVEETLDVLYPASPSEDRRRDRRWPVELDLVCATGESPGMPGRLQNISRGGMYVKTGQPVAEGALLEMDLRDDDGQTMPFARGWVLRRSQRGMAVRLDYSGAGEYDRPTVH